MSTFFTLIFLVGCFSSWYFIKKQPNTKFRNYSIITIVVSALIIGVLPTKEVAKQEKKVQETTVTKSKSSDTKKEEIFIEIPKEIETDDTGDVVINGKATKGARVSVGAGILGDSKPVSEDGSFSLTYNLADENDKELTINVTKNGHSNSAKIIVKANPQRIAQIQEKKTAESIEKNLPTEHKSALKKAKSYSTMMNMSKMGIYDQLISEYGEKFSPEAAQYAIDNLKADWNANALAKAKSYQESMAMSPEAIRDQLISEHGEKFTPEEADYAIQNLN